MPCSNAGRTRQEDAETVVGADPFVRRVSFGAEAAPSLGPQLANRLLGGLNDENHPVTQTMFCRRATAYRQMGYGLEIDESLGGESQRRQLGLFDRAGISATEG